MDLERRPGETCERPFPIYEDLAERLVSAHRRDGAARDPTVAHVLGVCAGFAYADIRTVGTMMARLGLEGGACVRVAQTVDAMFIYSTAYLLQSRCGRVAVLCYRGTEPMNLGGWLADADVGADTIALDAGQLAVHAGFYRNVRATRQTVVDELRHALDGRSLLDHRVRVDHPLEALYLTGHSLGGAMALLLALSVVGTAQYRAIADTVRAVYTFGQPIALADPVPSFAVEVGRRLYRHITLRDPVPALPAASWGRFTHVGHEYRLADGEWRLEEAGVAQMANMRGIPRSLLSSLGAAKRRSASRYAMADHGPHHYIAALRPKGQLTEFGDRS